MTHPREPRDIAASVCPTCGQNYNAGAHTELALAQLLEAQARLEKMEAAIEAASAVAHNGCLTGDCPHEVQSDCEDFHDALLDELIDALAKIEGRG